MTAKKAAQAAQTPQEPADGGQQAGTDNPWDRAYAHGEHPPSTLNPEPAPPAEKGHIGERMDPTPREHFTVAGQIKAMNEAADAAKEG